MNTPMNHTHQAVQELLLINGELRGASNGAFYDNVNPATGQVIGVSPDATTDDIEAAIVAARTAFDTTDWSRNVEFRVHCIRQLQQALADHLPQLIDITMAEVGAPRMACDTIQVVEPLKFLPYYADIAANFQWSSSLGEANTMGGPAERWTEQEAVGVVAAITPWNVPTQINLAKIVPALAAGCTVILKPAVETPWGALALGRLIANHTDIPAGVINIVTSSDKLIGRQLVIDPRIDMISFTGSTDTGRRIMADASVNLTKVFLELGGKSACIVLDDVDDIAGASFGAVFGLAMVCGQGCALTTRVLLPRSRYDEGVAAIAALMTGIVPGDPTAAGTVMGPLISAAQRDRVEGYVASAIEQGARIVCGGKRPEHMPDGFFYEPTLIADVTNDMRVAQEEIFGPVLVAIAYDDDDHAVAIANDSEFGLSGAVVSADESRALSVARRVRTGTMSVNGGVWYGCDVPFGGYKHSGIGREMGMAGFSEYLETRAFAKPVTSKS